MIHETCNAFCPIENMVTMNNAYKTILIALTKNKTVIKLHSVTSHPVKNNSIHDSLATHVFLVMRNMSISRWDFLFFSIIVFSGK